jgi:hypothetical protein
MKPRKAVRRRIALPRLDRQRFFQLAERLRSARDRDEVERVKSKLARLTFGS